MAQDRIRYPHVLSVLFTTAQMDALKKLARHDDRATSAQVRKSTIDDLIAAGLYDLDADPAFRNDDNDTSLDEGP